MGSSAPGGCGRHDGCSVGFGRAGAIVGAGWEGMRTQRKILVIDHDPHTTRMLRRWVGLTGVDVFAARSGWEHVEDGLKRGPSLILLSADAPDALAVQARLAASPETQGIPLAVVYSQNTAPEVRAAFEERVKARLTKPLDPLAVKPVLEGVFGRVPMRRGTSPGLELPSLPSRLTPPPAAAQERGEDDSPPRVPTSPGTPSPLRGGGRVGSVVADGDGGSALGGGARRATGGPEPALALGPREPTLVDAAPVAAGAGVFGSGELSIAQDNEPTLHDNKVDPELMAALLREHADELDRTRGELSTAQGKLKETLGELYESEARCAELEAQLAVRPEPTRPGVVNDPVVQVRLDRLEQDRAEAREARSRGRRRGRARRWPRCMRRWTRLKRRSPRCARSPRRGRPRSARRRGFGPSWPRPGAT